MALLRSAVSAACRLSKADATFRAGGCRGAVEARGRAGPVPQARSTVEVGLWGGEYEGKTSATIAAFRGRRPRSWTKQNKSSHANYLLAGNDRHPPN